MRVRIADRMRQVDAMFRADANLRSVLVRLGTGRPQLINRTHFYQIMTVDGETTWFEGAQLLGIFAAVAIVVYFAQAG